MSQLIKGIASGAVSAAVCFAVAIVTLARTNAWVMPSGVSLAAWDLVVFGVGATLVALIVHLIALKLTKPRLSYAFLGFMLTYVAIFAFNGWLQVGSQSLVAATIGALLATVIVRLRSNNSFKPTPLRGAA